jgi:hypothetical protein
MFIGVLVIILLLNIYQFGIELKQSVYLLIKKFALRGQKYFKEMKEKYIRFRDRKKLEEEDFIKTQLKMWRRRTL